MNVHAVKLSKASKLILKCFLSVLSVILLWALFILLAPESWLGK